MSLFTKYLSSKEIINRVYRDTGYDNEIPFSDAIDWIVDALDKINYPLQYIRKVVGSKDIPAYEFDNYRVPLPCDFKMLDAVLVNGYNVRPSTNQIHHLLSGSCCDFSTETDIDIFTDNFGNTFSPQSGNQDTWSSSSDITFDINDDFFTFSVKTGKVCLAYYAYPLDDEGYPLIPDEIYYKEAVKWYITYKIDYIQWRHDLSNQSFRLNYQISESEWLWYVAAAQNNAKMPDVGQMENMKNFILTHRPRLDHFNTFFRNLGANENIKIIK